MDHSGQGTKSLFEVEYPTGDCVWLLYHEVSHLKAVNQYLEGLGVPGIKHLPKKILASSYEMSVAMLDHSTNSQWEYLSFSSQTSSLSRFPAVPPTLTMPPNRHCGPFMCRCEGCHNQDLSPAAREPNSKVLMAFTHFFNAEAQAKELATHKEMHV
ncbi:uncharacterized protein EDB93DRAFT_1250777 [Suillus bovinus]|uniref:uncharacterized protein n=1 Tax=Suillus bovinus TaxID=48563 RepID=UPI001B85D2D0|nr:uncharacterized protein EDB93DRAFT_1250777 [Suillus bovinus]KAG2146495.1 hypothetical protein EDB93DRAFT_1250777 [Suillus bovinus]